MLFKNGSFNHANNLHRRLPLGLQETESRTFEAAFKWLERNHTAGECVETEGIKRGGEVVWQVMAVGSKAEVWRHN